MEAAAIAGRLAQYAGAAVLLGWPLLRLQSRVPAPNGERAILAGCILAAQAGAVLTLAAQTAAMTGVTGMAFAPADVWAVLSGTTFGHGLGARITLLAAALAILALRPSLITLSLLGAGTCASFAWTGHGVGAQGVAGAVHHLADIAHGLAAGAWLGALALLLRLVTGRDAHAPDADAALGRFSAVGPAVVAVLVLSGLVNAWALVGPHGIGRLAASAYGCALLVKLALFLLMLALAAANRLRLGPALTAAGQAPAPALRDLRRSLSAEAALGLLVLAAVAALGVLPPPSETMG